MGKIYVRILLLIIIPAVIFMLINSGCAVLPAISSPGISGPCKPADEPETKEPASANSTGSINESQQGQPVAEESTTNKPSDKGTGPTEEDLNKEGSATEPVSTDFTETELDYIMIVKEIHGLEADGLREIIAQYPYFEHEDGEEVFYPANNAIKNEYIDFWINDFRDLTDEVFEYMREDMPLPLGLEINYFIEYMDNHTISVLLHNFSYAGGAHPNTFTNAYNYDIENRKDILLPDLFVREFDYIDFLSDYCYEDIKKQYKEIGINVDEVQDFILDGTDPTEPENFENFNLTEDSLKINFDPYDVGPYVAGAFTVYIPYEKFEGKILYHR